jgi:hypothetical protein
VGGVGKVKEACYKIKKEGKEKGEIKRRKTIKPVQ